MKKIILLLLCLFLLGLAACDDKSELTPAVTVGEGRELTTDDLSGKTDSDDRDGIIKPDHQDKQTHSEIAKAPGKIEVEPSEQTIPVPEPVDPPVAAESVETTTTQE